MQMTKFEHVMSRVRTYKNWPTIVWPLTRLLPKERTLKTRNGPSLYVRNVFGPDAVVVHEQFFRDDYGFSKIKLARSVPIVLDLGANIGAFSLFALEAVRQRGGKIFAYEPDESNFKILQKNIALNQGAGVIIAIKEAIHTSEGGQEFFLSAQEYAHSLVEEQLGGASVGSQKVQCTTIEKVLKKYDLEAVDLLKLDIEGSEYEVLYQFPPELFKKIRNIVLEIHLHSRYSSKELVSFLEKQGFIVSVSLGNSNVYTARKD
ncbi:MAG: FkbM family methyltransferase [bacterium]|nr:FkbM family methyltransferase [bacterium]